MYRDDSSGEKRWSCDSETNQPCSSHTSIPLLLAARTGGGMSLNETSSPDFSALFLSAVVATWFLVNFWPIMPTMLKPQQPKTSNPTTIPPTSNIVWEDGPAALCWGTKLGDSMG